MTMKWSSLLGGSKRNLRPFRFAKSGRNENKEILFRKKGPKRKKKKIFVSKKGTETKLTISIDFATSCLSLYGDANYEV